MNKTNQHTCPECQDDIGNAKSCQCGWKSTQRDNRPKVCIHIENGERCVRVQKTMRLCTEHYELQRFKTGLERELEKGIQRARDEAKQAGLTNYEYFKSKFKGSSWEKIATR